MERRSAVMPQIVEVVPCARAPAASRDSNRGSNGTDSIIRAHWAHFQGGDVEKGLAELHEQANVMIDDLLWWTAVLKAAREGDGRHMKTPMKTHEGRVALVTGAAEGIGQAIALALADRGAKVIATDLNPPHKTVGMIGPTAYALELDVTRKSNGVR